MKIRNYVLLIGFFTASLNLVAQDKTSNKFGKGVRIVAQDSSFAIRFSARFQSLYAGEYNMDTHAYDDKMMIRRARLKFDGFAYTPKLTYKIELGLSNSDIAGAIFLKQVKQLALSMMLF